jgi:hypothetical protein
VWSIVADRLIQWDSFRVRVDAGAVTTLIRHRLPQSSDISQPELTFSEGAIEIAAVAAGAPIRARLTIDGTAAHEVRLAMAVHAGRPPLPPNLAKLLPPAEGDVLAIAPMIITLSLASLLPAFVDLTIAGAEIHPDGLIVSLGAGGADPPP